MAVTRQEVNVLFSSSETTSLGFGASINSDTFTFPENTLAATVQPKADSVTAAQAGDTCTVTFHGTAGDPDGTGGDEYSSDDQGDFVALLDLNANDPATDTQAVNPTHLGGRLRFVNNSDGRNYTISAVILLTLG